MLLGFKKEHARGVQLGFKQTTIRATRKNPPKVGEVCHCYTGLRTKKCRLLGRWVCTWVMEIEIRESGDFQERPPRDDQSPLAIEFGGVVLSPFRAERLLILDGFRSDHEQSATQRAAKFWRGVLPLQGHFVQWEWTAEGAAPLAHDFRLGSTEGALTSTPAAELDEFYIENAAIHVERMGRSSFCLIIDAPGLPSVHIDTGIAPGPEWYFNVWEDELENPKQFQISRLIKPR